eukprot:TRINITY_DN7240_c0_g1_i3.p1 TRINITY_DN7240_c0_g1~~TRINITY_DN7240_c0_g1_i3.p1  ORF type:complete len:509 (+),score=84.60 TRINITY_DN7240_c0_g1_i3:3-1529(+)
MKIAVEGCCHGELDQIYASLQQIEETQGVKVDLLLICGDFQAVRNHADLETMACPAKYKALNTFYKYYSGEKTAPVLTIFIGGNHEASNYLWELSYGGWVAPNIYYLGRAGVVNVAGVRIGGISGIYDQRDYQKGLYEMPPFNNQSMRSIYHTREFDVFQTSQLTQPVDVMLSHDWPQGIAYHGNLDQLLSRKSFLQREIQDNSLGNPATAALLQHLRPKYWFAAHLHVKFAAVVCHDTTNAPSSDHPPTTRFCALDKCLPRRHFLQVIDIPNDPSLPIALDYDLEWCTVLRTTQGLRSTTPGRVQMPTPDSGARTDYRPTAEELEETQRLFIAADASFRIPTDFERTVRAHPENDTVGPRTNPQTVALCKLLGIPEPCQQQMASAPAMSTGPTQAAQPQNLGLGLQLPPPRMAAAPADRVYAVAAAENPSAIDLDDDDDEDDEDATEASNNPDAIALDDNDEDSDDDSNDGTTLAAGTAKRSNGAATDGEPVIKRRNADIYQAEDSD